MTSHFRCLRVFLAAMLCHVVATSPALAQGALTVTASSTSAYTPRVPVGQEGVALISATASNVPKGDPEYGCWISGPTWEWTWQVQYAATPGAYDVPPPEALSTVIVDAPPATNGSGTTLRATFSTPGYWRITKITAKVLYTDSCGAEWTAKGIAPEVVDVVAYKVTIAPDPIFVAAGGTALPTVTVVPESEAPNVTFSTTDSFIATAQGLAPYVTVIGVTKGKTTLQASVDAYVLTSVEVQTVDLTMTPTSGPALMRVVFTMDSPYTQFFSANTRVQVDAVFQPEDFDSEYLTVSHELSKIRFDAGQPGLLAIAVADVFPAEFLASSNPALTMGLIGTVRGLVTLIDGDKTCTLDASFEITPSVTLGRLVNGVFDKATDSFFVAYTASSKSDLLGVDAEAHLYGQIIRPVNEFTSGAPTLTAELRAFRSDGTPVSAGVTVTFALITTTSEYHVYQMMKPFILITDPMLEGENEEVIALAAKEGSSVHIKKLPPQD